MDIRVSTTPIEGLRIVHPECFHDERGFFFESYRQDRFAAHGLQHVFVQDNHSRSRRGVLRGFHCQDASAPQARLVRCTAGVIWDVVVDLRPDSPTFGRWFGIELSADNRRQILIPPPFAHAFAVLSETADVHYKCTGVHVPAAERGLAWNDPDVAADWPVRNPVLSARDARAPSWRAYLERPAFAAAAAEQAS